jgi:hypothetical protein
MKKTTQLAIMLITSLLMMLPSCQRKLEFENASRIVELRFGRERFNDGQSKWELLEVLGPDGPYTTVVNKDYRGSGGQLGAGQSGTFTVSNGSGSVSKQYGGIEGTAFMAIPVQNRDLQNAVIVCHTVSAKEADAQQVGAGQPATRPEAKSEGSDKPQPEAEGRSR